MVLFLQRARDGRRRQSIVRPRGFVVDEDSQCEMLEIAEVCQRPFLLGLLIRCMECQCEPHKLPHIGGRAAQVVHELRLGLLEILGAQVGDDRLEVLAQLLQVFFHRVIQLTVRWQAGKRTCRESIAEYLPAFCRESLHQGVYQHAILTECLKVSVSTGCFCLLHHIIDHSRRLFECAGDFAPYYRIPDRRRELRAVRQIECLGLLLQPGIGKWLRE